MNFTRFKQGSLTLFLTSFFIIFSIFSPPSLSCYSRDDQRRDDQRRDDQRRDDQRRDDQRRDDQRQDERARDNQDGVKKNDNPRRGGQRRNSEYQNSGKSSSYSKQVKIVRNLHPELQIASKKVGPIEELE